MLLHGTARLAEQEYGVAAVMIPPLTIFRARRKKIALFARATSFEFVVSLSVTRAVLVSGPNALGPVFLAIRPVLLDGSATGVDVFARIEDVVDGSIGVSEVDGILPAVLACFHGGGCAVLVVAAIREVDDETVVVLGKLANSRDFSRRTSRQQPSPKVVHVELDVVHHAGKGDVGRVAQPIADGTFTRVIQRVRPVVGSSRG